MATSSQAASQTVPKDTETAPSAGTSPARKRRESDELEATELRDIRRQYLRATDSYRAASINNTIPRPTGRVEIWRYEVDKFWRNQVSVVVPHDACRDHLALERTFLGYLRTSLAFSIIGVTVAQLFRLQHAPTPDPFFGFFILGKPLACICQGAAIYTIVLGTYRSWRIQNAIVRGKTLTGGWEIMFLWGGMVLLLLMFLVLLIAVNVTKELCH